MPRCLLQQTCLLFILTLSLVYCHPLPTYQNEKRLHFMGHRHKPHLFYSGSESAKTLSWVVRLDADILSSTNEELDTIAERIAEDTQLVNHGQVGELRGHYLFASSLNRHILRPLNSDALSDSHAGDLGTTLMRENLTYTSQGNLSHSDWERVKLRSLILLDNHPYVEWHIQQIVRTRSKRDFLDLAKTQRHRDRGYCNQTEVHSEVKKRRARSSDLNRLQFNDPLFPKQWHLVSKIYCLVNPDVNLTPFEPLDKTLCCLIENREKYLRKTNFVSYGDCLLLLLVLSLHSGQNFSPTRSNLRTHCSLTSSLLDLSYVERTFPAPTSYDFYFGFILSWFIDVVCYDIGAVEVTIY